MRSPPYAKTTWNRHLLPGSVSQHSVCLTGQRPQACSAGGSATHKRREEHLAGRYCANRALSRLRVASPEPVERGALGEPVWPPGVVGSITHSEKFASAAVSVDPTLHGLGIDSELILPLQTCSEIASTIAGSDERWRTIDMTGLSAQRALTLLFSAKESLFKCVAPLIGSYFDFLDAELIHVDPRSRRLRLQLSRTLAGWLETGMSIEGGYAFSDGHVHTHVLLPRQDQLAGSA
jgi:enterobactin synthetase component D